MPGDTPRNGSSTHPGQAQHRLKIELARKLGLDKIRAALAEVGSDRTDDDWCRRVVKQATERAEPRHDLTAMVVACIRDDPEAFTPVPDYAPRYRRKDHQ